MTRTNLEDVDYRMFESRPYWVDNFRAYQDESGTDTLTVGSAITSHAIDDGSGAAPTVASIVGTVVEIWDSTETTKKAVAIITDVTLGSTEDTVSFTPIYVLVSGTTAVAQNDVWYVIGHASEEGSTSPNAYSDELTRVFNSTQQFESVVYASDRLKLAKTRPVDEWTRMQGQTGKAHKVRIENALLFGARYGYDGSAYDPTSEGRHVDGTNSDPITTTAGFEQIMLSHGTDPSVSRMFTPNMGDYTWSDFVDDMINIAYYQEGTEELFAFAGPDALGFFDKASTTGFLGDGARVNLEPSRKTEFGFKARRLYTNEIELNLVRTPALRGRYSKYMFITDPRYLGIAKYQPSEYKTNIQENDRKARKDEFFDDLGFIMTLVEKHAHVIFS
jgi:hypothetical protein